MKRFYLFAILLAVGISQTAHAGILEGLLTFNGLRDRLVDDSIGRIVDLDNNGVVSNGDIIQGIFQINKLVLDAGIDTEVNVNPPSIIGVYSFQVSGAPTIDGTSAVINTGAATGANSIASILNASGFNPTGLTDNPANGLTLASAGIAVFENAAGNSLTSFTVGANFVDGSGKIAGVIDPASGWAPSVILGFDGVDDFHQIKLDQTNVGGNVVTGAQLLTIANIQSLNTVANNLQLDITFGSFAGAYSVIEHSFSSDVQFLPLFSVKPSDGSLSVGDVVTSGSTSITNATGGEVGRGWLFGDKGDFSINAVPEPASMLVWGGLASALGLGGLIRRRKK